MNRVQDLASILPILTAAVYAQTAGTFTTTGSMTTPRSQHTATLLASGKVLIAGGTTGAHSIATAELYDPATGAFTVPGNMTMPRVSHSATLLPDGRVLIAGGEVSDESPYTTNTAEIYDPSTATFSPTGNMIADHAFHQAILLGNGQVLIAGGASYGGRTGSPRAELYDPATGTFAATGPYVKQTFGFNTAQGAETALLADGTVLLIWEEDGAELYDPVTGTFSATGNPIRQSYNDGVPTATLLMNGKVLVAGGYDDGGVHSTAQLYDPFAGAFSSTGNMHAGHTDHTANLLPDGAVLVAGTLFADGPDLYSPATGAFIATGNMAVPRSNHTATLLNTGDVLVVGGWAPYPSITGSGEIYHPAIPIPAPQLFSVSGDGKGQGAIWHSTTGEIASPNRPAVAGDILSMYTTTLVGGGVIPPQVSVDGRLAQISYFGAAPGYPGYNQVNFIVPVDIAAGAAVPVRINYIGRPSNAVTVAVGR
jgi:hypothetical protein